MRSIFRIDEMYSELLRDIIDNGYSYLDPRRAKQEIYRTQIDKHFFKYDLGNGFPALTTKKLAWKSVVGETLWILNGYTNIKYLIDQGINIWNKDAMNFWNKNVDSDHQALSTESFLEFVNNGAFAPIQPGDVGKNYGHQLRNWDGDFDQLQHIVDTLKNDPLSTKKVVNYWNPSDSEETALTPCHRSWEVMVEPLEEDSEGREYKLSLSFDMSSVDVFLGLPFNIASYALICHILAEICNMKVGTLYGNLSNVHLYEPHIEKAKLQLERSVYQHSPPRLEISDYFKLVGKRGNLGLNSILRSLEVEDFNLWNYTSYDAIPAKMYAYDE